MQETFGARKRKKNASEVPANDETMGPFIRPGKIVAETDFNVPTIMFSRLRGLFTVSIRL